MLHLIAALGGMLPTICQVAGYFAANSNAEWPGIGVLIALTLFAVIGAIVSFAMSPPDRKQALAVGISAPAIVTSLLTGAAKGPPRASLGLVTSAHAQSTPAPAPNPSVWWSGKTGIGPDDKVILFRFDPAAAASSATKTTVGVGVVRSNGEVIPLGSFPVTQGQNNVVALPADATSLKITDDKGTTSTVAISKNTKQVDVAPKTTTTVGGDLFWALGGSRSLAVTGFHAEAKATVPPGWEQYMRRLGPN